MGRTTVKRAPKNPKVIRWDFEGIGYAIHQALRKATDSDWSALMWNMVYVINDDQWGKWVEALMEFMRGEVPQGRDHQGRGGGLPRDARIHPQAEGLDSQESRVPLPGHWL